MRDSDRHYREMVDEAVVGMLRTTAEGQIVQVNRALAHMLGYESPEDMKARVDRAQDLYANPRERDALLAELMDTGRVESFQTDFLRSDGSVVRVASNVRAVLDADSTFVGAEGVIVDITDWVRAEEALRDAFEKEQQAAERLQRIVRMQDVLLTAVSHEMRTPLTAILGVAEMLQRHGDRLTADRHADLVGAIAENVKRLDRLLQGLLDIDRLRRGALTAVPVPVQLADIVGRTVAAVDLGPRTVHIEVAGGAAVIDPAIAERIIENLLVNVDRHTPPATQVWIRAGLESRDVILAVDDDGPGVPDDLKELVFQPFERGDPEQANPGAGLGLTLARQLAELHGGRCWVQDRPGGGAAFRVVLPGTP